MRLCRPALLLLPFASLVLPPATAAAQTSVYGPGVSPPPAPPAAPAPPPTYYPPPGYYYGSTGFYPSVDVKPPETLPFDDGQTVPEGYEIKTRNVRSAVLGGAITFGTTYFLTVLSGAVAVGKDGGTSARFGPLFAPIAGPMITIGTARVQGAGTVWLALDGIAQAAGAAILVYGLASQEKYLQYVRSDTPGRALAILAHPQLLAGLGSGAVRWTF